MPDLIAPQPDPQFVYLFEDGSPQSAYVYDFNYNGFQYTLIFSAETSLSDKCEGVYNLTGQSGVYDFINQNYPDDVEWGVCVPCDCESPYELSDPEVCLVCGSGERDDFFAFTGRNELSPEKGA